MHWFILLIQAPCQHLGKLFPALMWGCVGSDVNRLFIVYGQLMYLHLYSVGHSVLKRESEWVWVHARHVEDLCRFY